MIQCHIYIYIFKKLFSIEGYYKISNIVPCAIYYVLVVYLLYIYINSMYLFFSNSQFVPPPYLSHLVTISFLSLWVFFYFINIFICIILSDSAYVINSYIGYINIQKSVVFLYTNNKISEGEIEETMPFTIISKRIKYPGINLPMET